MTHLALLSLTRSDVNPSALLARFASLTCLALLLTCCTTGFSPRRGSCPVYEELDTEKTILAIGDSVFAWRMRSCETVPDVAARTLGRKLEHRAVNGARLTGGEHEIVAQFEPGQWDWVLLDGGGNDLNNECECGKDCDAVLDALISEDGTSGEIAQLVESIVASGSRVGLYGYFRIDEKAYYGFDECREELDVLHARQQRLAALHDEVIFLDAREVVSPTSSPEAYAFDHVHPSAAGARIVGEYIARKLLEAEADTPTP